MPQAPALNHLFTKPPRDVPEGSNLLRGAVSNHQANIEAAQAFAPQGSDRALTPISLAQWQGAFAQISRKAEKSVQSAPQRKPQHLADHLLASGLVEIGALAKAMALAKLSDLPLGDLLLAQGLLSEDKLQAIECEIYGARPIALDTLPHGYGSLHDLISPQAALRLCALPVGRVGPAVLVATANPSRLPHIRRALSHDGPVILSLAPRGAIEARITEIYGPRLARIAEARPPAAMSCRSWGGWWLRLWAIIGAASLGLAAWIAPMVTLWALFGVAGLLLVINTILRIAITIAAMIEGRALRLDGVAAARAGHDPIPLPERPVVTLLVPLLRESDIAAHLIAGLAALDYPRELLDILLVVEADDLETRTALAQSELPAFMRAIIVPAGHPRTKPRALNYALNFARGAIVGIYDAEDRPEPDQIWRVVRHFANCPPEVVCLQGRLDYYNPDHNWLARCFTIEYATWFRVMLRGVAQLGLFVPLGGTTLFLRRWALEQVGGWDAHNVTEDADLGLRLVRHGFRTELIDTTTFEEANSGFVPWLKQRSRWQKGYLLTWATAMRDPARLRRELGLRAFLGFQVQLLGTILGFLTAPLLWSFVLIPLGLPHPLSPYLGGTAPLVIGIGFLLIMVVNWATMIIACEAEHLRPNRRYIPVMEVYFLLATISAWMAVFDMIRRPFYWAKTTHGRFLMRKGVTEPPR